jgi:protein-S-isoprenylcysteine O-methyltransferase Ste14
VKVVIYKRLGTRAVYGHTFANITLSDSDNDPKNQRYPLKPTDMFEKATLLMALLSSTYISTLCFHSPNPRPTSLQKKDRIMSVPLVGLLGPKIQQFTFLSLSILHIIYTAIYPSLSSGICPHPDNVDAKYVTWSFYVIVCVGLIHIFGVLRLLAFQTLGKNFTFELSEPSHLVTTGIYAYVQHPSYPPYFILNLTNLALFAALDGPLGCFLPEIWVGIWMEWKGLFFWLNSVIMAAGLWARVRDEEEMLKAAFGREWEEWSQKTKRFIPWVI